MRMTARVPPMIHQVVKADFELGRVAVGFDVGSEGSDGVSAPTPGSGGRALSMTTRPS